MAKYSRSEEEKEDHEDSDWRSIRQPARNHGSGWQDSDEDSEIKHSEPEVRCVQWMEW